MSTRTPDLRLILGGRDDHAHDDGRLQLRHERIRIGAWTLCLAMARTKTWASWEAPNGEWFMVKVGEA